MMKAWALAIAVGLAAPAAGQLLGGAGGALGGTLGGVTGGILGAPARIGGLGGTLGEAAQAGRVLAPKTLLDQRRVRLRELVQRNRDVLDMDDQGNPVRRNVILALAPDPAALARATAAGFRTIGVEAAEGLDLSTTLLAPPRGKSVRKAIETLRALDPAGTYALDALYEPAHAPLAPMQGPAAGADRVAGARLGLIDGGVGRHPAFAGVAIEQRGFAGEARPSGHGTAVASLMVGRTGAFSGAAPGSPLLVADVYGGAATNGSAIAIVRAMAWLAQKGARVVNISLVGPPNAVLAAGVKALNARGIRVVAAVGNDGPAAPPQYPASYPEVIAVTGVDAKGKALIEAGKPLHLDFAAPGADMAGATPGGGWEALRGTSFAAPLVAAALARAGSVEALAAEAKPGSGRVGRGIVCAACRIPPRTVGLK